MIKKVELPELPLELRRAVEGYLDHHGDARLLGCTTYETTPWLDKTKINTTYKAYTEWYNVLIVHTLSFGRVSEDSILAGDIQFFIDNTDWFKSGRR